MIHCILQSFKNYISLIFDTVETERKLDERKDVITMKPKLTLDEQIQYMEDKGIKFNIKLDDKNNKEPKEQAKDFLNESNYFFKLKSFAKNYDKDKEGKYIRLEFAYLRELSILDTLLRDIILELCLTCEHLLKVQINNHCSNNAEQDGYEIVKRFLEDKHNEPHALKNYKKGHCNQYQKKLIEKYFKKDKDNNWNNNFALWNFIEILTFSEFIRFYNFYFNQDSKSKIPFLEEISLLRNAAAHNFCVLHNFKSNNEDFEPTKKLQSMIRKMRVFHKDKKLTHLKNPLIHDCICLLFVTKDLCPTRMYKKIKKKILAFIRRASNCESKEYFKDNQYVSSAFVFFVKLFLKII